MEEGLVAVPNLCVFFPSVRFQTTNTNGAKIWMFIFIQRAIQDIVQMTVATEGRSLFSHPPVDDMPMCVASAGWTGYRTVRYRADT